MFEIVAVFLIFPILTVYFAWISWKRLKFCQIVSAIPGPKSWPVVGNALQFDRTPQGKYTSQMYYVHAFSKLAMLYLAK